MLSSSPSSKVEVPRRVRVSALVSSRYLNGKRPLSWDERVPGEDVVVADDGNTYKLQSDGGQSPPQKGWIILLSAGDQDSGYKWTLYGISESLDN